MMSKQVLVLATTNANKIIEIKKVLRGSGITVKSLDLYPPMPEIIENGETLEANALKKAETIAARLRLPALADDSGLFVPALNGHPGVRSARYAGPDCDYHKNNRKLLRALKGKQGKHRHAYFATCMALAAPGKKSKLRLGKVWGKITESLQGEQGFGYDPLFIPRGHQRTFAQMPLKIKNQISHRGLALAKILPDIQRQFNSKT